MARYPLDTLRSLRDAEVDAAARQLGRAVTRTQTAEHRTTAARQLLDARVAERETAEASEVEHFNRGQGRVADLAFAGEWRRGAEHTEAQLRDRAQQAELRLLAVREAEAQARQSLVAHRSAAEAVERHHARWQATEARRLEKQQQEESSPHRSLVARHGLLTRSSTWGSE